MKYGKIFPMAALIAMTDLSAETMQAGNSDKALRKADHAAAKAQREQLKVERKADRERVKAERKAAHARWKAEHKANKQNEDNDTHEIRRESRVGGVEVSAPQQNRNTPASTNPQEAPNTGTTANDGKVQRRAER